MPKSLGYRDILNSTLVYRLAHPWGYLSDQQLPLSTFACYLCKRSILAGIQCDLRLVVEPIVPRCAMVEWWGHDLLKEFLQWLTIIALLTSVVLNISLILEAIERRRKQDPKAK
jgi:hypothetical protein